VQNLPVILAVFAAAAAIIFVLLWRIKLQPIANTEAADRRVAEEAERVRSLQTKLDAGETTLRDALVAASTAEANMAAADARAALAEANAGQAKIEITGLQQNYQAAEPLIATATEQRRAAEGARAEVAQRLATLEAAHKVLQTDYELSVATAATAQNEAANTHIRNGEILAAYEVKVQELAQVAKELTDSLAKQQADEAAASHFKVISQEILDKTLEEAKRGVGELAASFQKSSGAELEKHADKITRTLEPLQAQLTAYDAAVESLKKGTQENYGSLREQLSELQKTERSLHDQAKALTTALSASPKVKGSYGEMILKQLVEFVGMQEKCHFETQASRETEEGRKIPDLVVSLPGGQKVLVDAKAVMDACVEAHQTQDDAHRLILLRKHCDHVRSRVLDLSSKNYFANHKDAVEAVVLFLPAENLYATALENDAELTEFAMKRNIIICGPNSLMMLLKVANQLWRRASIEEEVQDIKKCGEDIFKAACGFIEKFVGIGKKIQLLENEYNDAVATLEGRLLPAGKRMSKFEAVTRNQELSDVAPVKDNVRELREATQRLIASTQKLPGLVVGDETSEFSFSSGDE